GGKIFPVLVVLAHGIPLPRTRGRPAARAYMQRRIRCAALGFLGHSKARAVDSWNGSLTLDSVRSLAGALPRAPIEGGGDERVALRARRGARPRRAGADAEPDARARRPRARRPGPPTRCRACARCA